MITEISIIIPTLNEKRYISKLLISILEQNFGGKLEIIIVDGNSSDNTIEVANSFKNKISDLQIFKTEKGVARQRNYGASKAKYGNLLFIDADIVLSPNILNKITGRINDKQKYIATVMYLAEGKNLLYNASVLAVYSIYFLLSFLSPITQGGFFLIGKKLHNKINGFKEGTILFEDVDYGRRALKAGAKWYQFKSLFVFHSIRRAEKIGAFKLFMLWFRAYWFSRKKGQPIYPGQGFDYPYGNF